VGGSGAVCSSCRVRMAAMEKGGGMAVSGPASSESFLFRLCAGHGTPLHWLVSCVCMAGPERQPPLLLPTPCSGTIHTSPLCFTCMQPDESPQIQWYFVVCCGILFVFNQSAQVLSKSQ
jgi:hypothetical protein